MDLDGKSAMESTGSRQSSRRALIEAVIASTVGTTIEWYDFFLYGTAAALIFRRLFFPELSPLAGQLAAFSTFTVGFVGRPLGGVIFGYLGDRVGRKASLVATLLLMGVSTMLIGVLPTFHDIGIAAPIILATLRFIQGIGVGGEWGGAVLVALEYSHRGKRGFYASWPQAGVPLGLLASTGVLAFFEWLLPDDQFLSWGWRIPFLLSGLLIGVGMLIRVRIMETPLFLEMKQKNLVALTPVRDAIRNSWRQILLATGARISENSCFYLFTAYVITYAKDFLNIEAKTILLAVNLAAAAQFCVIPIYGRLSDHWSRKRMYVLGSVVLMLFAWPYYALLETRDPGWIIAAVVLSLAGGHSMLYSVQASLIPELFDTRIRYTASSISYQLASPFAGGLAPLIATWLTDSFREARTWVLPGYIVAISILSLCCVISLAETSKKDLGGAG